MTMDYVMAGHLVVISVCLLLTLIWLTLRAGTVAITLLHSVGALARSLVVEASKMSASTQTGALDGLADEQEIPPTVVDASPAKQSDHALVGENTDSVDKGSATSMPTNFIAKLYDCQRGSAALPSTSTRTASPSPPRRRERNRSAPERKRAAKVRLSPPSSGALTQRMNTDEIRRVVAKFREWMVDRRLTGRQIAVADVWTEALNFARAKNITLPKRDRLLEALARTPGVEREYDVRLDGETKTTIYTFSPLPKRHPPTGEFMNSERARGQR